MIDLPQDVTNIINTFIYRLRLEELEADWKEFKDRARVEGIYIYPEKSLKDYERVVGVYHIYYHDGRVVGCEAKDIWSIVKMPNLDMDRIRVGQFCMFLKGHEPDNLFEIGYGCAFI